MFAGLRQPFDQLRRRRIGELEVLDHEQNRFVGGRADERGDADESVVVSTARVDLGSG